MPRAATPTSNRSPYYLTTPIYYVNDRPHIGHCYTTLVGDVASRFARLIGGPERPVFFMTGTDEHAEKVAAAAAKQGMSVQAWADRNAGEFRAAFDALDIRYDDFMRTSQARHKAVAARLIQRLLDQGDIALGDYEGWWDPSQEEYVTESTAKEHDYKSPVTKKPLERRTEQNYFFRLSGAPSRDPSRSYAELLTEHIERTPGFILPEQRKNEVLGRLRQGLNDVPVSRRVKAGDPAAEEGWGILMPGDAEHRVYVWIEALMNYLTGVDEATPGQAGRGVFWREDARVTHLLAKDILWFHAVVWPAMLIALDIPLPTTVYAHAYFVSEGMKMSKSLGNFIEIDRLRAYAEKYSADAVRWYLATQGPLGATDADFAHGRFVEVYNADLANGLGNCASRVGNMIDKYFGGAVPDPRGVHAWTAQTPQAMNAYDWPALCREAVEKAESAHAAMDLHGALRAGAELISRVDAFIGETRPFSIAKLADGETVSSGAERMPAKDALAAILYQCAEAVRVATLILSPALPAKTHGLWRAWNCDPTEPDAENPERPRRFRAPLAELAEFGGAYGLRPGAALGKPEAMFMRADPAEAAPGSPGA